MNRYVKIWVVLVLLSACGEEGENRSWALDLQPLDDQDEVRGQRGDPDEEILFFHSGSEDVGFWGELEQDSDNPFWPGPQEGECESHDQCSSGWCLVGSMGGRCAPGCEDAACGSGASCERISMSGADMLWVCLPDRTPFCRPCHQDEDCGMTESVCLDGGGPVGRYCTRLCDALEGCPEGFACQQGVCHAAQEECDCRWAVQALSLTTRCERTNHWGRCEGLRVCTDQGLTDCDAALPQKEVCDGVDNNCDGRVDEGIAVEPCLQGNTFGYCVGDLLCNQGAPVCTAAIPGAEVCDGSDNDCDHGVDEPGAFGCVTVYRDEDGDGVGGELSDCLCGVQAGWATLSQDCNDQNPFVHPGADEACDGLDNNCDDATDEVCDVDADGYCGGALATLGTPWCPQPLRDCQDQDPLIHPLADELCNGLDDDCDGAVDEQCDADGDGYCGKPALLFGPGSVCASQSPDCRDEDPAVHPGAPEECNGRDDDCDGLKDEGCDGDGDGYCEGSAPNYVVGCAGLWGSALTLCLGFFKATCAGFGDCNDDSPLAYPGAIEVLDGLDNNCNGWIDEN